MSERGKLSEMTEDELKELSLQKKKNGCYTSRALAAQRKLWDQFHYPINNYVEEYDGGYYDNGYETVDIVTQQY